MFYRLLFGLFIVLSCSAVYSAEQENSVEAEEATSGITEFHRKFLVRFLCNYNFVSFWSSEYRQGTLNSSRPVDVGLGFGYKDFYWDFIYALPFTTGTKSKSVAFETGFDFFPRNWWIEGKYRRYSGFNMNDSAATFVDFWQRDAYVSFLWMGNSEGEFSPRAAFFLDRKQARSAGSVIIGGRLESMMAVDYSGTLEFYRERRRIYSSWADLGYSYTWVFDNDMFLNLWGVAGVAVSGERTTVDFSALPELSGKAAWGYIGETWSWNCVMEAEYLPSFFDDHWEQKWVSAFKILVVRRF